ncbi:MAG: STAS domain-containing protein [Vulcanimicrobiaceae bacterium]
MHRGTIGGIMGPLANFDVQRSDGVEILSVTGEIDISNIDEFRAILLEAEREATSGIIVSLRKADYLCVRTFGLLIVLGARLTSRRKNLVIVCRRSDIASRVLGYLRFPYHVVDSTAAALAAMFSRRPS